MRKYIGFAAIYGWCAVIAYSMLLTGDITQRLSPFLVCFLTFTSVAIIFSICNAKNLPELFISGKLKQARHDLAGINLSSFISWGLMIYPLAYIEPTIVATIILGVNPIATAIIIRVFFKQSLDIYLVFISLALALLISMLIFNTLDGNGSLVTASQSDVQLSLVACVFSGIATSCNNVFSKRLMGAGLSISDLMCLRFFLTILLSGLISAQAGPIVLNADIVESISVTTIFFVIVPLLLLQVSLKNLDPLQVSVISPLMPVLVIIMQYISNPKSITIFIAVSTLVTWALVTGGTYLSIRSKI